MYLSRKDSLRASRRSQWTDSTILRERPRVIRGKQGSNLSPFAKMGTKFGSEKIGLSAVVYYTRFRGLTHLPTYLSYKRLYGQFNLLLANTNWWTNDKSTFRSVSSSSIMAEHRNYNHESWSHAPAIFNTLPEKQSGSRSGILYSKIIGRFWDV